MQLYNTRTRSIVDLHTITPQQVTVYCCGPTVYDYTHLGHLRKYTMDDLLIRTLAYTGLNVKHVMNITDVGHLVSDGDEGEDKLEKGALKTGKTVWEVAAFYTAFFQKSMDLMHVRAPQVTCKATDHIPDMIALVETLIQKGFAYETAQAVYFDVMKDPDYGALTGQKLSEKKIGARDDVHTDPDKHHPADFALWFKRVGRFADHSMHWTSPWGDGFPGWHIECSAMSMKYLGPQIDIHTGGIDHISVHHPNEIAQSECATGAHPYVGIWMHHNFLTVEGQKMSKSLGNFFTVDDVLARHINPSALRLLFLQSHYRSEMNFTWEALHASEKAFRALRAQWILLHTPVDAGSSSLSNEASTWDSTFTEFLTHDLNTAGAVATLWKMLASDVEDRDKQMLFSRWNTVLGLDFTEEDQASVVIPTDIHDLARRRQNAKTEKLFAEADALRRQISDAGYEVVDHQNGSYEIHKKN